MSNPIIVLGMHRSGTTLLTDLLIRLGVDMGGVLEGNLEDRRFLLKNELMLKRMGLRWDRPFGIAALLPLFQSRMIKIAGKREMKSGLWGWKDPRTVLTYPVWRVIYPDAKWVVVYRNGVDVANSLSFREIRAKESRKFFSPRNWLFGFSHKSSLVESPRYALRLWEYYNKRLRLINGEDEKVLIIKYEDFLAKPIDGVMVLSEFCGVACERDQAAIIVAGVDGTRAYAYKNGDADGLYDVMTRMDIAKDLGY